jgi:hypothetical protein
MTALLDWRGDPVMPAAWLEGYLRLHPIHREPFPVGGDPTQAKAARLDRALAERTETGMPHARYRGVLR